MRPILIKNFSYHFVKTRVAERISDRRNVMKLKQTLGKIWNLLKERPICLMVIGYLIACMFFAPTFFTGRNISSYLVQCTDTILFSIGLMFVTLNGGIDFSSAAMIGFGSLLVAWITNTENGWMNGSPLAIPVAVVAVLVLCVTVNVINGFAVVKLKLPSFIATMATNMIFMGIALTLSMSSTIANLPASFSGFAKGKLFGVIPNLVIVTAIAIAAASLILNRMEFGRRATAVGSNPTAANISGLPVKPTIMQLFILNGIFVGIAVLMTTSRLGVGKAGLGENRVMDFVAAVVIGGTSCSGGSATVLGTVLGAMFITLINNSLSMLGWNSNVIMIIKGTLILVMALVDAYRIRTEQSR